MKPSRRHQLPQRRAGWQLIELSMVIAVLAIISVSATRAIIALMAVENRSGQALQEAEVLTRLGQSWRSDLHRATSATVSGDGASIELRQPTGPTITYRIHDRQLTREEPTPNRRSPARETFAVSARAWQFEAPGDGRPFVIVRESAPMNLTGHGDVASPPVIDRIEAALATLRPFPSSQDKGATP